MQIVGVIPAAGYATRLQPLDCSKEVLLVGGRPVMDYLVDRMRIGGCTRIRIVTRPEKGDVIAHAEELGAEVVLGYPRTVSESFLAGMEGVNGEDIVLFGFPDTLWEPKDGYQALVRDLQEGCDVALGLFQIAVTDLARSDIVVFTKDDRIAGIDVKPARPRSEWVWGCAAGRARIWAGLHGAEWPGGYIDLLCREGRNVCGIKLSGVWLDIGTRDGLQRADADVIGWSANR